jgi:hypothetical protein
MSPLTTENLNISISNFFRRRFPKNIERDCIADIAYEICNNDSKENIEKLRDEYVDVDIMVFKELKEYVDALKIRMFGDEGNSMMALVEYYRGEYIIFFVFKKNYTADTTLKDNKNVKFTINGHITNIYYEFVTMDNSIFVDYIGYF